MVWDTGRSLNPKSKLRYITIIYDETKPKLFGLDKVDLSSPTYITEGPLDSLFIPNAIAMCGSDVHLGDWGISNRVWVYDNEPRNPQIVDRIRRTIDSGDPVVIWPKGIGQRTSMIWSLLDTTYKT